MKHSIFVACLAIASFTVPAISAETQYWIYAGQSNLTGFNGLREVVQKHEPDVQLKEIRSGIPGTPIQSWLKDDPWQERDKTGWKILLEALKKKGDGEIAGMVWYQGESNTKDDALQYEENLKTVIKNVRTLVGKPKLPVIVVQLATCRNDTWGFAHVREAQRQVAVDDPLVEVVCGLDLDIGDNNVHLSSEAKNETGRRQGLAALRLVYGKKEITHGPQFSRAFFASERGDTVVVEFFDVKGVLQLSEGWRQGFSVLNGVADSSMLSPSKSLLWPIHAEVIADNQVAVVFDRALDKNAKIGWGMAASACIGPYRSWDMPIRGLSDDTGITAIAFSLANISPTPADFSVPKINVPKPSKVESFDPAKPFQLAINGIGRSAEGLLAPKEEAGAPDFRQAFWNSAHKGVESYLRDSRGLRTPIAVHTSCWYASFVGKHETPDQRLMGSYNRDRSTPTRIVGLLPNESYDIVLYHNMPDRPNEAVEYSVGTPVINNDGRVRGIESQIMVRVRQPKSTDRAVENSDDQYAFVEYVECTKANDFTGNYLVFRNIKADEHGEIYISPKSTVKGGRTRFTALQILYHGK